MRPSRAGPGLSAAGLVVANLAPLVGVLAFGWDAAVVLVTYWLESGAVGVASAAKVLRAEGRDDPADLPEIRLNGRSAASFVGEPNGAVAGFFAVHYGFFWVVHGVFVFGYVLLFGTGLTSLLSWPVAVATVGLAASHAVSYRVHYLGDREYEAAGPVTMMVEPYRRVLVLHVTVVVGALPVGVLGSPVGAVAVLVLLKTVLDLRGHRREHDRGRRRSAPATGD